MRLRFSALMALVFLMSACTSLTFNQSYQSASWKTIAIAPFSGDSAELAQEEFVDAFATNHHIVFIVPELIEAKIEELGLETNYQKAPLPVLITVAKELKADGLVYGRVETSINKKGSYSFVDAKANVQLIDSSNGVVVGSSLEEASFIFGDRQSALESVMESITTEFEDYFEVLKPGFNE